ncbi:hypothetical protein [Candidatus Clostridium radicumherbarum]|uniref:Uncharacterized protein n=1 Tax=Candidatus Clostridium radicumherbarum TaxID=3381662 RepID=A0ABW8TTQ4_9CLOT
MLSSIKKILESVVSKGIYDLLKYLLLTLVVGIAGLFYNFFALHGKYLLPYAIVITFIAAVTICLLILLIYKENNPIFNIYKKTDFQYILLEKDLFYDYTNLDCIKYEKKVKLKMLCDNVDRFYDKYNWTGDSNPIITSSNQMHEIVPTPKRDSYNTFEVYFGRTYKKGDVLDLKLSFIMEDKGCKADTAISTTIDEPIRNLKIKIKVCEDYREGPANASIYPVIDGRHSIYYEKKYFDNDGVIEWETKDPEMLTRYSLTWNPPKQNN